MFWDSRGVWAVVVLEGGYWSFDMAEGEWRVMAVENVVNGKMPL